MSVRIINGKVYTGMLPSGYANADLKWETSEQTDLGIDLRFFNSALTFSADYFVKKTKDMLLSMPMRSHRPLQRTFSPSISISWYFRLEEPQLITRIFMEYPP